MPDYMTIAVEGFLPLGQRWVFRGDALGAAVPFRVGYDNGVLTLPDTPTGEPGGHGPMGSLQAPPWLNDANVEADWGQVVGMPMRLSLIGALGIRVQLAWHAEKPPGREQLEGEAWNFATGLFPWLRRVRSWLSAVVGADLTTESPDDLPGGVPEKVRLRAVGSSEWAFEEKKARAWNYSTKQAIGLENWRRAVRLASDEAELPVEHLLLIAAREALEQRNMRLGAIEAGSAAETAMRRALLEQAGADNADRPRIENMMLGGLRKFAEGRVDCPAWPEFNKLLDARNAAVHGNRAVWYPEVREAIRVATGIVNTHRPLPP